MGSSSAFTVGLLNALYALQGRAVGKKQLASESIHIEQEMLKEMVGSQDQVCAAYGGLNRISFLQNGEFSVQPMTLTHERMEELTSHLMLFYTGIKRTAATVATSFVPSITERSALLNKMRGCVDKGCDILNGNGDLAPFGELLHEAWQDKRSLSDKISNAQVDAAYDAARSAGALGGKLLGAGGGGFLLVFAPPAKHAKIKKQLNRLIQVPFKFEFGGSQVIFHELEEDYSAHDKARDKQQIEAFRELDANAPGAS
jgi:D-glycero-alpha-D-manno-heptose-7-phosphate kinase